MAISEVSIGVILRKNFMLVSSAFLRLDSRKITHPIRKIKSQKHRDIVNIIHNVIGPSAPISFLLMQAMAPKQKTAIDKDR